MITSQANDIEMGRCKFPGADVKGKKKKYQTYEFTDLIV